MKIGLNTNTFPGAPLPDIIALAKKLGVGYLELWASNLDTNAQAANQYSFANKNVAGAKKLIDEAGLKVGCLAFGMGLDKAFFESPEAYAKEFLCAIETARAWGVNRVLHYGVGLFDGYEMDVDKLARFWSEPIALAEKYGIVLAIENEPIDFTYTPENMRALLDAFPSPSFKTNYDATNYFHSGNEPFPHAYDLLRGDIAYVHIKNGKLYDPKFCLDPDWICDLPMTRALTGKLLYYCDTDKGVVNTMGLLSALQADGYDGMCTLEEPHVIREKAIEAIRREVLTLRNSGYFTD